jgi:hypothetical protein
MKKVFCLVEFMPCKENYNTYGVRLGKALWDQANSLCGAQPNRFYGLSSDLWGMGPGLDEGMGSSLDTNLSIVMPSPQCDKTSFTCKNGGRFASECGWCICPKGYGGYDCSSCTDDYACPAERNYCEKSPAVFKGYNTSIDCVVEASIGLFSLFTNTPHTIKIYSNHENVTHATMQFRALQNGLAPEWFNCTYSSCMYGQGKECNSAAFSDFSDEYSCLMCRNVLCVDSPRNNSAKYMWPGLKELISRKSIPFLFGCNVKTLPHVKNAPRICKAVLQNIPIPLKCSAGTCMKERPPDPFCDLYPSGETCTSVPLIRIRTSYIVAALCFTALLCVSIVILYIRFRRREKSFNSELIEKLQQKSVEAEPWRLVEAYLCGFEKVLHFMFPLLWDDKYFQYLQTSWENLCPEHRGFLAYMSCLSGTKPCYKEWPEPFDIQIMDESRVNLLTVRLVCSLSSYSCCVEAAIFQQGHFIKLQCFPEGVVCRIKKVIVTEDYIQQDATHRLSPPHWINQWFYPLVASYSKSDVPSPPNYNKTLTLQLECFPKVASKNMIDDRLSSMSFLRHGGDGYWAHHSGSTFISYVPSTPTSRRLYFTSKDLKSLQDGQLGSKDLTYLIKLVSPEGLSLIPDECYPLAKEIRVFRNNWRGHVKETNKIAFSKEDAERLRDVIDKFYNCCQVIPSIGEQLPFQAFRAVFDEAVKNNTLINPNVMGE